jgi:hypothetical protein
MSTYESFVLLCISLAIFTSIIACATFSEVTPHPKYTFQRLAILPRAHPWRAVVLLTLTLR